MKTTSIASANAKKHYEKLYKSIDNKLFDLLIDLDDQNSDKSYNHWKINQELKKVIMKKILLDKNIKLHVNTLGVYTFSEGKQRQYKNLNFTIGKNVDNTIIPLNYYGFDKKNKNVQKSINNDTKEIKRKYEIDLAMLFKSRSDLTLYKKCNVEEFMFGCNYIQNRHLQPVNNYNKIKNFNFSINNEIDNMPLDDEDELDMAEDIHHPKNTCKFELIDNNAKYDQNQYVEYHDKKKDDINDNINININENYDDNVDIEAKIRFYEEIVGRPNNNHKNKDRVKYLNKLISKFDREINKQDKFNDYYNHAKQLNEYDF